MLPWWRTQRHHAADVRASLQAGEFLPSRTHPSLRAGMGQTMQLGGAQRSSPLTAVPDSQDTLAAEGPEALGMGVLAIGVLEGGCERQQVDANDFQLSPDVHLGNA